MFLVVDELRVANWQRSKDGARNRNKPKPISPLKPQTKRIGQTDLPPEEVKRILARIGPASTTGGDV